VGWLTYKAIAKCKFKKIEADPITSSLPHYIMPFN